MAAGTPFGAGVVRRMKLCQMLRSGARLLLAVSMASPEATKMNMPGSGTGAIGPEISTAKFEVVVTQMPVG